jgi:lipoprotein-anchoring transpeptidase ErfK/SrfK
MGRWIRVFLFLFLISMAAVSLFATARPARAQAEEGQGQGDRSFLGHIVQPGEDLESIAAHYNTSAAAIAETNHLSPSVPLNAGQLLRIRSWDEPLPQPSSTGGEAAVSDVPAANPQIEPSQVLTGEKWIDVDLSEQTLTAYQGDTVVKSFLISSGLPTHPTVTGTFHIWAKVASQTMTGGSRAAGDYYNLPNVQWVQYFFEDYSIHGTYWHNNFGHPMSHGCVNMQTEDAQWLFDWADPHMDQAMVESDSWLLHAEDGTRVEVHD